MTKPIATTIKVPSTGKVLLSKFKNLIDISKVVYYSLDINEDKTLTLKFFDKNKKLIKPKENKDGKEKAKSKKDNKAKR